MIIVLILKILSSIANLSMNIFSFSLTIYCFINYKKLGDLRIFILLPALSFVDSFSLIILTQILSQKNSFYIFSEFFQIVYLCIELAIIIFFYLKNILRVQFKFYYFTSIIVIVILLSLRYFLGLNVAIDYLPLFVVIESLIVNIFFGVLISYKIKEDGIEISQWVNEINNGFFLFVNTTTPYYLTINYLDNHQEVATTYLNFIGSFGYIILFYHIYKAKKCYLLN